MNFKALQYFLSLVELGGFTAAAKAHHVTQPAVSIQLKKLQEELGTNLFEAEGHKIRLTEAGVVALDYARRLGHLKKTLIQDLKAIEGLEKGKIAIGTVDAASMYVLPKIFSRFHALHPHIDITLEIDSTLPLVQELQNGKLDLVVGTLPIENQEGLTLKPIYQEDLILIAPTKHPLVQKRRISPQDISAYPMISFQKGSITRRLIEEAFLEKGITPSITMGIDSPEVIKHLVASGLGLAILPANLVAEDLKKRILVKLSIQGMKFQRSLGLILLQERAASAATRAFLSILAEDLKIMDKKILRV